jgi:glucose dehydrogenase
MPFFSILVPSIDTTRYAHVFQLIVGSGRNVLFAGESGGALSAFASADGRKLWSDQVSAGVNAPPVTYTVNGRQFVAVAAGGNVLFGFKTGDELIAYALPSP